MTQMHVYNKCVPTEFWCMNDHTNKKHNLKRFLWSQCLHFVTSMYWSSNKHILWYSLAFNIHGHIIRIRQREPNKPAKTDKTQNAYTQKLTKTKQKQIHGENNIMRQKKTQKYTGYWWPTLLNYRPRRPRTVCEHSTVQLHLQIKSAFESAYLRQVK